MVESYLIVGADSDKIRGIVTLKSETSEKAIGEQRDKVCKAITSALVALEQPERLEIVPATEFTEV